MALAGFIKPMHREGWKFLLPVAALSAFFLWLYAPVGWVLVLLTIWVWVFFRDPKRAVPLNPDLILSPADGTVSEISRVLPPPELGLPHVERTRISVFMTVMNVHVNRAPVSGRVTRIAYEPGKFMSANLDKASDENERNSLTITLGDGRNVIVTQIAGLIARRILCLVSEEEPVQAGQRFGLIRFGSRVDTYLPDGVEPMVAVGQTAIAGETVLARLDQNPPPIKYRKD